VLVPDASTGWSSSRLTSEVLSEPAERLNMDVIVMGRTGDPAPNEWEALLPPWCAPHSARVSWFRPSCGRVLRRLWCLSIRLTVL
jgi:hypothetical protein